MGTQKHITPTNNFHSCASAPNVHTHTVPTSHITKMCSGVVV